MKQFIQSVRNGKISVEAVPPPVLRPQGIRVRTAISLISAGTERAVLKLSQKNLLGKAKARPDLVRKVLDKLRRDGFMTTFQSVREKLDRQAPLGYSVCGEVIDVGDRARDYPIGHVRWTENRNMETFLDMVARGAVRPEILTTHRFTIDDAQRAFEIILAGRQPHLGIMLTYPEDASVEAGPLISRISLPQVKRARPADSMRISFIGAGGFSQAVLLPNLKKVEHAEMQGIVTASGLTARSVGKKFGFNYCASTIDETLEDENTDALFIVTRHSQHADIVCRGLAAESSVRPATSSISSRS